MRTSLVIALLALFALPGLAAEELISTALYKSGEPVPYILNTDGAVSKQPKYVVILFPGGSGVVDPRIENGVLTYGFRGNFLVRSRSLIVDEDFVTVTTKVVHHRQDQCRSTSFFDANASHERFGNEFIAMEGGISVGGPCEARAYHGFNGIERETVDAIKQWIRKGG